MKKYKDNSGWWALALIIIIFIIYFLCSCSVVYDIKYSIEHRGEADSSWMPYYTTVVYKSDSTLIIKH